MIAKKSTHLRAKAPNTNTLLTQLLMSHHQ
jgi:hypothetical protein